MNNKRKKRMWGYFIIVKTDTDFKESWARRVIANLLTTLDEAFESWSKRARVELHFEELTPDEVKELDNRL